MKTPNLPPPPLDGLQVTSVRRVTDTKTKTTPLVEYYAEIQDPESKHAGTVAKLRAMESEEERRKFKQDTLPAVCLSGLFKSNERKKESLISHSGRMLGDFDDLEQSDVPRLKALLGADPHCEFVCLSPSGKLKGVFLVPQCSNDSEHKICWGALDRYLTETHQVQIDPATKDCSRLSFITNDPDAIVNFNAKPIDIEAWSPNTSSESSESPPHHESDWTYSDYWSSIKTESSKNRSGEERNLKRLRAYAERVLETACDKITTVELGNRHGERLREAYLCGGYAAAGLLDQSNALQKLEAAALANTLNSQKALKAVNDAFHAGRQDPIDLEQLWEQILRQDWEQQQGSNDEDSAPPLQFRFDPIESLSLTEPDWVIEDLIEANTLTMIFGAAATAKSFLALDLIGSIITGNDWRGHHAKKGSVLYFCGEGKAGLTRRRNAYEVHHGESLGGSRLFVSNSAIDLGDSEALLLVKAAIREVQRTSTEPLALGVIDTLARHNSGDENDTQAMSKFITGLDKIREEFGCTLLVVHHAAKDAAKGARGSTALRGALDTEILMERMETGEFVMSVTKQKDAVMIPKKGFELKSVNLQDEQGRELADKYGQPITSCVLVETEVAEKDSTKPRRMGKNQQAFCQTFSKMWNKAERSSPGTKHAFSLELLRVELEANAEINRKRWNELIKDSVLNAKFIITDTTIELRENEPPDFG